MNNHYRFYEIEDFFRSIHDRGIRYAELWTGPMHFYVDDQGHDDIAIVRNLSKKYDITIIGICPEQTNPKPYNIAVKQEHRKQAVLHYYMQQIDVANALGVNQVLVTSGWCYYSETIKEAWNRSVCMMKKIANYARTKNVYLVMEALQPDESRLVNTIDDLKKYRKDVDQNDVLTVCVDFGAMARAKDTLAKYFEAFKTDIKHIHFVDGSPCGHLAWGDGTRDLDKDIKILEEYAYAGYLSLETANARYFEEPWVAEEKTLRQFINRREKQDG